MLVWDKLAQFVVIATAEWFDILPMFNGTLIRNFLYLENVNSRLFTLLAFIHIGVPLIVAIIMWVHVQRVPRAHINPPRPIAIAVTLMFLALALVKPILSQGGEADMSVVPTNIAFDWFETAGAGAGLCHRSDASLVLGARLTALLFLIPWLPPKRSARPRPTSITFHPDHKTVSAASTKPCSTPACARTSTCPTNAATAAAASANARCCSGKVDPGLYQPSALSAPELAQGKVLMCCATALDDVEIEYEASATAPASGIHGPRRQAGEAHPRRHARPAQAAGRPADPFKAGQYINIILDDGQRRAFSFANPPHEPEFVELQIRLMPGGRFTTHVSRR
jgi:CDP-4-dehydro-6-deoxyglucose reductase